MDIQTRRQANGRRQITAAFWLTVVLIACQVAVLVLVILLYVTAGAL